MDYIQFFHAIKDKNWPYSIEELYQAFKARFNAEQDAALKALMDQEEKAMD